MVLLHDWHFWARGNQRPPDGDWTSWLILAGRGFGKTRTGAEWVRGLVEAGEAKRIALVAPTAADARDTMVEGESGLIAVSPPWSRPVFEPSKRRLTWPCGATATLFSADEPERLRGPQHDAAWCDMFADILAWCQLVFWPQSPPMPELTGTETLITVLMSLLGLGGLRTVEKLRGRQQVDRMATALIRAVAVQGGRRPRA